MALVGAGSSLLCLLDLQVHLHGHHGAPLCLIIQVPAAHPLYSPLASTCSITHSLALAHPLLHSCSFTPSLPHSHTHSVTCPPTHPLTHSLTHSLTRQPTQQLSHTTQTLTCLFTPSCYGFHSTYCTLISYSCKKTLVCTGGWC